jgi:hypothetical protein
MSAKQRDTFLFLCAPHPKGGLLEIMHKGGLKAGY